MNFDSRIISFYEEIKKINNGQFPFPRVLSLYPTNMCQFSCTFCDYKELNSYKPKQLSKLEWTYILNTFKNNGGESIHLCGGGEPLMLSTIEDLIIYANKLGLKIGLVTNGANIIARKKLYYLLSLCSYIRISFEAGSSEVFREIKGKDYFDRILSNISYLVNDNPNLQVSYKYTISSKYLKEDIESAVKIADSMKFHSIQFKAVCNTDEKLSDDDRKLLNEYINSIPTKNTKLICNLERYEKKENGCPISLIQTLIDYYGDIYICCYYNHRINDHRIGNIFENKFENIWGSYEHYKKLMSVDCNKCNLYDCRYIKYDTIMNEYMEKDYLKFI